MPHLALSILGVVTSGQPLQQNGLTVAVFVISALLGMVLATYIQLIIGQSTERQRLIVDLESARQELTERERLAGALKERQRLAPEIHDILAQSLISIIMHVETVENDISTESDGGRDAVHRASVIARESLCEARRSVHGLRPEALEDTSLPDALRRIAHSVSEDGPVMASTTVTGTIRPLHPEVDVALLRVAQEATTNVRRHADPCRMALMLSYVEDSVILDVRDDGAGTD